MITEIKLKNFLGRQEEEILPLEYKINYLGPGVSDEVGHSVPLQTFGPYNALEFFDMAWGILQPKYLVRPGELRIPKGQGVREIKITSQTFSIPTRLLSHYLIFTEDGELISETLLIDSNIVAMKVPGLPADVYPNLPREDRAYLKTLERSITNGLLLLPGFKTLKTDIENLRFLPELNSSDDTWGIWNYRNDPDVCEVYCRLLPRLKLSIKEVTPDLIHKGDCCDTWGPSNYGGGVQRLSILLPALIDAGLNDRTLFVPRISTCLHPILEKAITSEFLDYPLGTLITTSCRMEVVDAL